MNWSNNILLVKCFLSTVEWVIRLEYQVSAISTTDSKHLHIRANWVLACVNYSVLYTHNTYTHTHTHTHTYRCGFAIICS